MTPENAIAAIMRQVELYNQSLRERAARGEIGQDTFRLTLKRDGLLEAIAILRRTFGSHESADELRQRLGFKDLSETQQNQNLHLNLEFPHDDG